MSAGPREGWLWLDETQAVVRIEGAEREKFLQGLLTNDMQRLAPGASSMAALCSAKGRVIATLLLLADERGYWCLAPVSTAGVVVAKLRAMIFRSKVAIDGPLVTHRAGGLIGAWAGGSPAEAGIVGVLPAPGKSATPRCLFIADHPTGDPGLAGATPQIGRECWEASEIMAGVPSIEAVTSELFLPQNLDLEPLGALSFTKGCYPGQEVVARTQYLGEVKRRLYRARVVIGSAEVAPAPGDAVRAVRDGEERDGGRIVNAAPDPDPGRTGQFIVLAVLPVSEAEGELRLRVPAGSRLEEVVRPA